MNAGIERFGLNDREAVRRSMRDLRLEPALAREVLSTAARKAFQARPCAGVRVGLLHSMVACPVHRGTRCLTPARGIFAPSCRPRGGRGVPCGAMSQAGRGAAGRQPRAPTRARAPRRRSSGARATSATAWRPPRSSRRSSSSPTSWSPRCWRTCRRGRCAAPPASCKLGAIRVKIVPVCRAAHHTLQRGRALEGRHRALPARRAGRACGMHCQHQ